MKKYLYLFFVALFATLSFTLTSCGDDDDEPNGGNIVGTWEAVDYPYGIKQIIQFASNGTYTEVTDDEGEVDIVRGKWTQNGNKVSVISDELDIPIDATIVKINDKELVLDMLWKLSYKKVSDAALDKYLK